MEVGTQTCPVKKKVEKYLPCQALRLPRKGTNCLVLSSQGMSFVSRSKQGIASSIAKTGSPNLTVVCWGHNIMNNKR